MQHVVVLSEVVDRGLIGGVYEVVLLRAELFTDFFLDNHSVFLSSTHVACCLGKLFLDTVLGRPPDL